MYVFPRYVSISAAWRKAKFLNSSKFYTHLSFYSIFHSLILYTDADQSHKLHSDSGLYYVIMLHENIAKH